MIHLLLILKEATLKGKNLLLWGANIFFMRSPHSERIQNEILEAGDFLISHIVAFGQNGFRIVAVIKSDL